MRGYGEMTGEVCGQVISVDYLVHGHAVGIFGDVTLGGEGVGSWLTDGRHVCWSLRRVDGRI